MATETINITNARWLTARILGKGFAITNISPDVAKPLEEALFTLSVKEITVLGLRFGLYDNGGETRTLQEVGDSMGLTREWVRQIEMVAIRKLRHPSRSRKLKAYVDRGGG